MKCDRCYKETNTTIMSRFNTDIICRECKAKEVKHPMYREALEAERAEVLAGNYNFDGIGKPADL